MHLILSESMFSMFLLIIFPRSIKSIGSVINPEFGFDCSKLNISDSGDVETGFLVGDAHLKLQERAIQLFTKNGVPFVIGGGGDVAVPVILGLAKHMYVVQSYILITF